MTELEEGLYVFAGLDLGEDSRATAGKEYPLKAGINIIGNPTLGDEFTLWVSPPSFVVGATQTEGWHQKASLTYDEDGQPKYKPVVFNITASEVGKNELRVIFVYKGNWLREIPISFETILT